MPIREQFQDDNSFLAALRDYFAGQFEFPEDLTIEYAEALAGRKCPSGQNAETILNSLLFWMEAEAKYRYIFADAMLAERSK